MFQATGGVPRLINQVCDHVLLLAYVAGRKTIEPANIEEAWADLQQLPTPWNGERQRATSGRRRRDRVRLAGRPSGRRAEHGDPTAEVDARRCGFAAGRRGSARPTDGEPVRQIHRIEPLLAEADDDFQPAGSIGPEIELCLRRDAPSVPGGVRARRSRGGPLCGHRGGDAEKETGSRSQSPNRSRNGNRRRSPRSRLPYPMRPLPLPWRRPIRRRPTIRRTVALRRPRRRLCRSGGTSIASCSPGSAEASAMSPTPEALKQTESGVPVILPLPALLKEAGNDAAGGLARFLWQDATKQGLSPLAPQLTQQVVQGPAEVKGDGERGREER